MLRSGFAPIQAHGKRRGLARRLGAKSRNARSAPYALTSTPPVIGADTPVVPGKVMGRPFSERTAI
jgi:hypothetical protein